jgi:hypothetical protein
MSNTTANARMPQNMLPSWILGVDDKAASVTNCGSLSI